MTTKQQAINQIQSQIQALLVSPLGAAIGKPSSFSPEPMVKFYALTGLTNDQDSYTMAVAAKAACLRVALSYPKSLFVGDELSVLFKRDGFASMVGELCATARKDGLSIILSSQDPDTICNSSAAAMIMQNITYRLTGVITSNAVASFERYLGYPADMISQNASESFFPRKTMAVSAIGVSLIWSFGAVSSADAATTDTTQSQRISEITRTQNASWLSGSQASAEVQDFLSDVGSFVQGDLFGGITQLVQSSVGSVQVPDLGQVVSQIMKGTLPPDVAFATKLENNLPASYAIRQDAANQSERVGALQVAQTQTLSKTAQDRSQATLQLSGNSASQTVQMAEDSQSSDTSQHILQNISAQLSNQAAIADLQMQEASLARQDRALQLTLTAQAAQELNAANTKDRQTLIATGNSAAAQGALLTMPGGAVLGESAPNP